MYCTVRMLADSRRCPLTDNIKNTDKNTPITVGMPPLTGLQKGWLDEWVDGHG